MGLVLTPKRCGDDSFPLYMQIGGILHFEPSLDRRVLGQSAVNYTRCAPSEDGEERAAKPRKKKGSKASKKKKK